MKTAEIDKKAAKKFVKFYKLPEKEFYGFIHRQDWKGFLDRCRRFRPRPLYFIVDNFPEVAWVNLENQLPDGSYKTEHFVFKHFWIFAKEIKNKTESFWRKVEKDISKRAEAEEIREKVQIQNIKSARYNKKYKQKKTSEIFENNPLLF
jgi:hypothetical protein